MSDKIDEIESLVTRFENTKYGELERAIEMGQGARLWEDKNRLAELKTQNANYLSEEVSRAIDDLVVQIERYESGEEDMPMISYDVGRSKTDDVTDFHEIAATDASRLTIPSFTDYLLD